VLYQSYELSFCLGGGLKQASGIARLTPKGIEYGLACNDKPERCAKTPPAIKDAPFTGVLSLSADSIGTSSPGGPAEPAESLDLFDLIGKFY
jgi:hypothetical protein